MPDNRNMRSRRDRRRIDIEQDVQARYLYAGSPPGSQRMWALWSRQSSGSGIDQNAKGRFKS